MTTFKKATKKQAKLRLALVGLSGGGKTFTGLKIASALGDRVAVIDTERGSASKYSDIFSFDVLELESFEPQHYIEAIQGAGQAGYGSLLIDSLSHAWSGKGGILEQHDKAVMRQKTQNSYAAWRDVTPLHNELVDTILQAPLHVIVTMRAKTEYVQEKDERTKKTQIRKVGLAPVQRDGMEYEFDVVADMDQDNNMIISKSRCVALSGQVFPKPGDNLIVPLKNWLTDGVAETEAPPVKRGPAPGDAERFMALVKEAGPYMTESEKKNMNKQYKNGLSPEEIGDFIVFLEAVIEERGGKGGAAA